MAHICAPPPPGVKGHRHHLRHMETLHRYCTIWIYFTCFNHSSLQQIWCSVNDYSVDGVRLHLKIWETPPAKILLDNSNCLCLLTVQWECFCVQHAVRYWLKLTSTNKYRHWMWVGFHSRHLDRVHVYKMSHPFLSHSLPYYCCS